MIPTGRLVMLAFVPVVLALAAAGSPGLVWPLIAVDLVVVGVAVLDAALSGGRLQARREVDDVQAVGRDFSVTLSLGNHGRRTLSIRVTDDAPGPAEGLPAGTTVAPGAETHLDYETRVESRGRHAFGPITVRWRSPLGLWDRQRRFEDPHEVRVYPNFQQLRRYGLTARSAESRAPVRARRRPGGENEFERLRPYVPGDPYRHIDWKATARRQEFISREFTQESNQNVIFLLDAGRMMSATHGGLTGFDHALNAAVMMGQTALQHGDRVGMLVFDREIRAWLPPRGGRRSGARLIQGTYDLFPSLEEPDYGLAFRWLGQRVKRRSLVVLLTSVVDEVNAELATQLVRALSSRHLATAVWIRDSELDTTLYEGDPWERAAAAELLQERQEALSALRRRGALVLDCSVEDLTPLLISRYLEVKARRLL